DLSFKGGAMLSAKAKEPACFGAGGQERLRPVDLTGARRLASGKGRGFTEYFLFTPHKRRDQTQGAPAGPHSFAGGANGCTRHDRRSAATGRRSAANARADVLAGCQTAPGPGSGRSE